MLTPEKPIDGVFVRELKNRFLCEVMINGISNECYVPSSCRLDNFLDLRGKKVLLLPTRTASSRTSFSLLAVPYKRNYILLNTSRANKIIEKNLFRRFFSSLGNRSNVISEYRLGAYKSDLYLPDSKTIIEIKSVITLGSKAEFPTVFSQRTINQFNAISKLMDEGFKAALIVVSLSPYVSEVQIDRESAFFGALFPCIEKGLQLLAVTICFTEDELQIKRKIKITYKR